MIGAIVVFADRQRRRAVAYYHARAGDLAVIAAAGDLVALIALEYFAIDALKAGPTVAEAARAAERFGAALAAMVGGAS